VRLCNVLQALASIFSNFGSNRCHCRRTGDHISHISACRKVLPGAFQFFKLRGLYDGPPSPSMNLSRYSTGSEIRRTSCATSTNEKPWKSSTRMSNGGDFG